MLRAVGLLGRKKASRPFGDYFLEWIETLKNTHLPLLRRAMRASPPCVLSTHVESLHGHFQEYYKNLDLAAGDDVAQMLFPEWRNSLEKAFLWVGDLHPYLFTNLLRSFLEGGRGHWRRRPEALMGRIEQVECGLRLMVPALAERARAAQGSLVERAAAGAVGDALEAHMEEMVGVFLDANRLRRSVLLEIVGAASVYQAALFLEGLAQFLVGFRDPRLLADFNRCSTPLASH